MISIVALYISVFVVLNTLVITLFKISAWSNRILFYRGIALIAISAVLTGGGFGFTCHHIGSWRMESIVAATIISASLQMTFFVTVPVTLDRSISAFLLGHIEGRGGGISKVDLTNEFLSEYVYKRDAIGRRIREQTASRNVEVSGGAVKLSRQGRRFLRFATIIARVYGIDFCEQSWPARSGRKALITLDTKPTGALREIEVEAEVNERTGCARKSTETERPRQ